MAAFSREPIAIPSARALQNEITISNWKTNYIDGGRLQAEERPARKLL